MSTVNWLVALGMRWQTLGRPSIKAAEDESRAARIKIFSPKGSYSDRRVSFMSNVDR